MVFSRVLFRFAKKGDARHLSHRDLMRLFERALRRAGLPVRMSQGFNPHPRLSILAALPVGIEADDEVLELEFEPPIAAPEARERLAAQLPRGIALRSARTLPEGVRPRVASVVYEVELPEGLPSVTPADVERLLARQAVVVPRGSATERAEVDIRPALRAMSMEGRALRFELAVADRGTPRASEVLAALLGASAAGAHCRQWAPATARMRRTQVNLSLAQPPDKSGTAGTKLREGDRNAT